jgi:catechol 2,3-dioxygenase-like lactoylglutathione lyase family enzyme
MITGLHHGNIVVSDLERSKRFYTEILGLQIVMETEINEPEFARGVGIPGTIVRGVFLAVPNTPTVIEMFQYTAPRKSVPLNPKGLPSDIGIGHLCFQVDDIEAVYGKLKEKGIPFVSSPVTIPKTHKDVGGVRFCYFKDPDGILLEILSLPPQP